MYFSIHSIGKIATGCGGACPQLPIAANRNTLPVQEPVPMPSFLSRLFGSAAPAAVEPVLHKDCRIYAQPIKDGAVFRIAARIEKDMGGTTKTHNLMRADTSPSLDEATEATIAKAKLAIDQLGDTLFR
jgi:hypothetical protein